MIDHPAGVWGFGSSNPWRTLKHPEEMVISSFNQILAYDCILDTHAFTQLHLNFKEKLSKGHLFLVEIK